MSKQRGFLLDTHVVLWSLYEPDRLPLSVRTIILEPHAVLSMSEASLWELTDKAAKGRLPLAGSSPRLILESIVAFGLELLPVTQEDILASVSLPSHHGDPFDRILVALARRLELVLVSRDPAMSLYDVPVSW